MMSTDEFHEWCTNYRICRPACLEIDKIRKAPPSRRPSSRASNVSGSYPSQKMGVTITFESYTNELAAIYRMEHSKNVLEYYDQPPRIQLRYKSVKGRRVTTDHTPDFFVIYSDGKAAWEEWKTEEYLQERLKESSNRYVLDEKLGWRCPLERNMRPSSGLGIDFDLRRNIIEYS